VIGVLGITIAQSNLVLRSTLNMLITPVILNFAPQPSFRRSTLPPLLITRVNLIFVPPLSFRLPFQPPIRLLRYKVPSRRHSKTEVLSCIICWAIELSMKDSSIVVVETTRRTCFIGPNVMFLRDRRTIASFDQGTKGSANSPVGFCKVVGVVSKNLPPSRARQRR
jgi:hypothetical protein